MDDVNEHTPAFISQNYLAQFFIDGENPSLPETQQVYRMTESSKLGELFIIVNAVDEDFGRNGKVTYTIVEG